MTSHATGAVMARKSMVGPTTGLGVIVRPLVREVAPALSGDAAFAEPPAAPSRENGMITMV